MDSALNRLKGSYWNPGLTGAPGKPANVLAAKQGLANLAVVMSMANNAKVSSLFAATNARIYQAFQGIDNIINTDCGNLKDHDNKPFSATWASAYSTWMTDKVASQNQMITASAAAMSAAIPTENVEGGKQQPAKVIAQQSSFISNFNAAFQVDALTFPAPGNWPNNPLPIQKRQACTLSAPSSNPTASATGSATSQGTNIGSMTVGTASPSITAPPTVSSTFSTVSSASAGISSLLSSAQSSPAVSSPVSSAQAASAS